MKYRVTHTTKYSGDQPVSICHNEAWLQPRNLPHQQCGRYELTISPQPSSQTTRLDYFGNYVAMFSFYQGYENLVVASRSEVTLHRRALGGQFVGPTWQNIRDQLSSHANAESMAAYEYVFDSPRISVPPDVDAEKPMPSANHVIVKPQMRFAISSGKI